MGGEEEEEGGGGLQNDFHLTCSTDEEGKRTIPAHSCQDALYRICTHNSLSACIQKSSGSMISWKVADLVVALKCHVKMLAVNAVVYWHLFSRNCNDFRKIVVMYFSRSKIE